MWMHNSHPLCFPGVRSTGRQEFFLLSYTCPVTLQLSVLPFMIASLHTFPQHTHSLLGSLGWGQLCGMLYHYHSDCLTPLSLAQRKKVKPKLHLPVGPVALPRFVGSHLSLVHRLFHPREAGPPALLLKVHVDFQPSWSLAKWSPVCALGLSSPLGRDFFFAALLPALIDIPACRRLFLFGGTLLLSFLTSPHSLTL